MAKVKICKHCGKQDKNGKAGYCNRHYIQLLKFGKLLEVTKFDKNNIIIDDGYSKIELRNQKHDIVGYAIIDNEDVEKIKYYKWSILSTGYVASRSTKDGKYILLHRLLTNAVDGINIDHINNNPLDNRKVNFRECTQSQNCMNMKMHIDNKLGIKGILKHQGGYRACLTFEGKQYRKQFKTINEAINYRKELEEKFFGDFNYKQ